jgi:hypothetical protein
MLPSKAHTFENVGLFIYLTHCMWFNVQLPPPPLPYCTAKGVGLTA